MNKTRIATVAVAAVVIIALIVMSMNKFEYVTSISGGMYFDSNNVPDVNIIVHKNRITGKVKFSVTSGKYAMGVIVNRDIAVKTLNRISGGRIDYNGASRSWMSENNDTTWVDNDDFRNSSIEGYPTFTTDFISDEIGAIFIFDPEETYKALKEI